MDAPFFSSFLCLFALVLLIGMIFLAASIKIVPEYERLAVYRLGRYLGERGPGVVILVPIIDRADKINSRLEFTLLQAVQKLRETVGETKTSVMSDGQVEIAGQVWDAISPRLIPPGTRVKVKRTILEIEAL